MDPRNQFFSGNNKTLLYNHLIKECQTKTRRELNDKQKGRLEKTLSHYMREVASKQSGPVPIMNREVIRITAQDFTSYIITPIPPPAPIARKPQAGNGGTNLDTLSIPPRGQTVVFEDTGKALEMLQKERTVSQGPPPAIPDFRITTESEDGPSPMELYEMAKKAREREALIQSQLTPPTKNDILSPVPEAIDTRRRLEEAPITVPPPRVMALDVPAQPSGMQHILVKNDDTVQYKELEQNLFVNSLDRDWTKDALLSMNRYNFTINFDPSAASQTQNITPYAQKRFRNIVRIQLIKTIISRETLDVLLTKTDGSTYVTTSQANVLSFPSVNIRIAELDGNNYGTNPRIDDSFGLVHYDAQWVSDPAGASTVPSSGIAVSNGYTSLVPKFLNCERVYEPTPLATLQKLSIRLERPTSATLLSDISDVIKVSNITMSTGIGTSIYNGVLSSYSPYIFIKTDKYFSKFMWETGDRVIFRGVNATLTGVTSATEASVNAVEEWVNREEGHLIVAIGYGTDVSLPIDVTDGANTVGYANYIIIQNRFTDPSINGSTAPYNFGNESNINSAFNTATAFAGAGINASHQVQLVFKVVTREYDATTKLRPGNL
jgi:hypothetical protein